jgi:hypothetical protein
MVYLWSCNLYFQFTSIYCMPCCQGFLRHHNRPRYLNE